MYFVESRVGTFACNIKMFCVNDLLKSGEGDMNGFCPYRFLPPSYTVQDIYCRWLDRSHFPEGPAVNFVLTFGGDACPVGAGINFYPVKLF